MTTRVSLGVLIAGVVALGAVNPTARPAPAPAVSAAYTHANLSVFVVRAPDTFDAGNVMTLQEALAAGLAVVHETGNVNMLAVENTSDDRELFLQSGDIVKGGKQDRIIGMDMLLPPKSGKVACAANCCEQRRWTGRGKEEVTKFTSSNDFAVGNDLKKANAAGGQAAVWENVALKQQQLSENVGKLVNAAASPSSLQLALEDKDLGAKLAAYEAALAKAANYPDAVGVIVAVNGQVIAADVYGSAKLFKKVWPKLLKAAAADALAQLPAGPLPAAPSVAAANEFLATAGNNNDCGGAEGVGSQELNVNVVNGEFSNDRVLVQQQGLSNLGVSGGGRGSGIGGQSPFAAPPSGSAQASQIPELGVLVDNSGSMAGQQPARPEPQPMAGRYSATSSVKLRAAGGNVNPSVQNVNGRAVNDNLGRGNLNPSVPAPQPAGGVTVIETRAPAQPAAVVHRSLLK